MKREDKTFRLVLTAMMAALCYVAFTFLQIKIPTPAGYTSFHLGNVFCVLAALLINGICGGLAGAIGMGIGDLFDPAYVITAPKTIFLKFMMGLIAGFLAHKKFKINELKGKKLVSAVFISCLSAAIFNIIAEPTVSYFYYKILLGKADKALSYLTVAKWITTSFNSLLTFIITSLLYLAIRKRKAKFNI